MRRMSWRSASDSCSGPPKSWVTSSTRSLNLRAMGPRLSILSSQTTEPRAAALLTRLRPQRFGSVWRPPALASGVGFLLLISDNILSRRAFCSPETQVSAGQRACRFRLEQPATALEGRGNRRAADKFWPPERSPRKTSDHVGKRLLLKGSPDQRAGLRSARQDALRGAAALAPKQRGEGPSSGAPTWAREWKRRKCAVPIQDAVAEVAEVADPLTTTRSCRVGSE